MKSDSVTVAGSTASKTNRRLSKHPYRVGKNIPYAFTTSMVAPVSEPVEINVNVLNPLSTGKTQLLVKGKIPGPGACSNWGSETVSNQQKWDTLAYQPSSHPS